MSDVLFVLKPLVLTVLLEGAAGYLLGLRTFREQCALALINGITNPLLVLVGSMLMYRTGIRTGMILVYAVLEPIVVLAESMMFRSFLDHRQPLKLSLILNLVSVLGGILCSKLL